VEVEYPLGHRARRREAMPLLLKKFESSVRRTFAPKRAREVLDLCTDRARLIDTPVNEFMDRVAI
jgi:2-methylcitrate dehydratase